jgi:nitroreductase / dihydropteridine reductase
MEFKEIVQKRYAVKKFDGQPVPEKIISELLELARLAPSALNLQPWKIKVITDARLKEQLLPASWNQPQITSCSHLLVLCANTDIESLVIKVDKLMLEGGVPADTRNWLTATAREMSAAMPAEAKLAWAQAQVYLLAANILNGAKALGLDSCPMSGFAPQEYARILNLPDYLVPVMACPVGYAADTPAPKLRFTNQDILI